MLRSSLIVVVLLICSSCCYAFVTDVNAVNMDFSILPQVMAKAFESSILPPQAISAAHPEAFTVPTISKCVNLNKSKEDWIQLFDAFKSKAPTLFPRTPFCVDQCRRVTTLFQRNFFCLLGVAVHSVKVTELTLDLKELALTIPTAESIALHIPVNAKVTALADWDCGIAVGQIAVHIESSFTVDVTSAFCIPEELENEDLEKMLRGLRVSPSGVKIKSKHLQVELMPLSGGSVIHVVVQKQEEAVRQRLLETMESAETAEKVLGAVKRLLLEKGVPPVSL